ncbi:MAG: acyl-CoA dehydrogenase family protein [Candidatus Binatia bacterium]
MDFDDTKQEAEFRAEVRSWLEANTELRGPDDPPEDMLGERLTEDDLVATRAWQKKKAEAGWACLRWPKEYGGRDATTIQSVIWGQEESKFRTPPNIFGIGHGMCGPTIMTHGSEEQKKRWIPKLLSGEELWCQLFSEPAAGSDLAGLRTSAVRDGDDWIINGQKIWTTGAQFSDWGIIVTRSDPNAPKHKGLTYFVVDMHSPGVEVRPIHQINGGQGFNEVFFTDVRIPDANRLDEIGNGWRVALTTLMNERSSIGAGGGGGGISGLIELARSVEIDGRPALEQSAVKEKIADFMVRARGVKYTGLRTLTALSQGRTPGPEASFGKLVGGVLGQDMAAYAMELQGVAGGLNDPAISADSANWQSRYLGFPGLRIAGGTDEVLRNIISERVLGMPAEMRVDKTVPFKDIPSGT